MATAGRPAGCIGPPIGGRLLRRLLSPPPSLPTPEPLGFPKVKAKLRFIVLAPRRNAQRDDFFFFFLNHSSIFSETEPPGHNTACLAFVTRERQDRAYVNFQHAIVLLGLLSYRLGGGAMVRCIGGDASCLNSVLKERTVNQSDLLGLL